MFKRIILLNAEEISILVYVDGLMMDLLEERA